MAAAERQLRADRRDTIARFGHKVNGTPETHAKAARVRQGVLARMYEAGAITIEQLGSSQEIRAAYERIVSPAAVRTVSLETRVDTSRMGDETFFEALGQVRREIAYTRWAAAVRSDRRRAGVVQAVLFEDAGLAAAARRWRMRDAGAKAAVSWALDLWPDLLMAAIREVDHADLLAAQAGLH